MQEYKRYNNITGWIVFAIATVVYLLTIESTTSLWDCGEFIASAYKLEIGHPPGAPFFMLLGRFFSLFTNDVQQVAWLLNMLSGLASSFTVLFLFWTITHIARKVIIKNNEYSKDKVIAIIGSGIVGALAFTFTDSFWFSAVEGEVYATSSFFTAIVFWAILKWENEAGEKHANRWLILIAYLMGLSIGVHLLNLLTIPAIVLVYYFKKYKYSKKGLTYAIILSFIILGFVNFGIIPGIIKIASKFELLFVNSFGLPYNTGALFAIFLLFGLIIWGIYYTHKHKKILYNHILLFLTVILLGYSAFAMIVIRSAADPPMDENNPENFFSLRYYINREQYGDRPLLYGPYFNAPVKEVEQGEPHYVAENGKYVISSYKRIPKYDDRFKTLFPRMYSTRGDHKRAYKQRINYDGTPVKIRDRNGKVKTVQKPTFLDNLEYFFKYQIGHMYFRYFMWNFSGRQNDIQGFGGPLHGNFITGIKFIDKDIIGTQNIPDSLKGHESRNTYYLLPLIIGLIGFIFHAKKHPKNFLIIFALFFLTGIAIILYLNQPPIEPRERDYTYAGSFYAFSIWIGLGVLALFDFAKNLTSKNLKNIAVYLGVITVAAALAGQIFSGDLLFFHMFLYMSLISFALIVFMFLLGRIVKNRKVHAIVATVLLFTTPVILAAENWEDHDRSGRYTARDMAYNYLNSCAPNSILFTNGDNDTFPLWYIQEVEGVRTDVRVVNLMLLNTDWHIAQSMRKAYESDRLPISLPYKKYREGSNDVIYINEKTNKYYDIEEIIKFIKSNNPQTQLRTQRGERVDYIPTRNFILPVDSASIVDNNVVDKEDAGLIVPEIRWSISKKKRYLSKSELCLLDILANNDWERPIYFVSPRKSNTLGLVDYLRLEGYAYRLIPVKTTSSQYDMGVGRIETDILYQNMMEDFKWGNMGDPDVYLGHFDLRTLSVIRLRHKFHRLANALIEEGKKDSALAVLDKCMEVTPKYNVPYDFFVLDIAMDYYRLDEDKKANNILKPYAREEEQKINYYSKLIKHYPSIKNELQRSMHILQRMGSIAERFDQKELAAEIKEMVKKTGVGQQQLQPRK